MPTETSNKTRMPVSQVSKRKAPAPQDQTDATDTSGQGDPSAPREPNKTDKVLALLKRTDGATLDDLVQATGWLTHTTRAALTGLKKKGHHIERTKVDGVSRYMVSEGASR